MRGGEEDEGDFGAEIDMDALYVRCGGYCSVCKGRVARELATVEHLVARANGGTDDPENLRIAHRSCNSSKGVRDASDPPRRTGLMRQRRLAAMRRRAL